MKQAQNSDFNLESVIGKLIKTYPDFYEPVAKNAENWIADDGKVLWTVLFGSLASFIKQKMCSGEFDGVEGVFHLIEDMVQSKCEPVATAATTGFLECLVNSITEDFPAKVFVGLLGPKSKEYIKAWDKFTGVKTDGLWQS